MGGSLHSAGALNTVDEYMGILGIGILGIGILGSVVKWGIENRGN